MFRSSQSCVRGELLLVALVIVAGAWLMTVMPALAQGEETPEATMTELFFKQPDLAAPLVVPMILALGGILTLLAFLAWVIRRMP